MIYLFEFVLSNGESLFLTSSNSIITQEYKKYSDKKIKKKLTEKELNILEKHRNKEENHENERLNRIKKQNIKIEESYNLANRLLLK